MNIRRFLSWTFVSCIFLLIVISGLRMLSHPSVEFDEGVYALTFRLVSLGFPVYKSTFLSQPPGFFLLTYPFFLIFGKSLIAGRVSIFIWSLVSVGILFWIGKILKKQTIPFVTIALLYLSPVYTTEILTFHADSLSVVSSLLSIGALLVFVHNKKTTWYILSWACIGIAVCIKGDVTFLPSLLIISLFEKVSLRKMATGLLCFFLCLLLISVDFGLQYVVSNVILIRIHAGSSAINYFQFFYYLFSQKELLVLVLLDVTFLIPTFYITKQKRELLTIIIWFVTSCIGLLVYHPLFLHHMFFIVVPSTLLFSFCVVNILEKILSQRNILIFSMIFLSICICVRVFVAFHSSVDIVSNDQQKGIRIIQKYTVPSDMILSDDGLLVADAQRMAPPFLSDISYVRLQAGDISVKTLRMQLRQYHPRLILAWNGRLLSIPHSRELFQSEGYKRMDESFSTHIVYIRNKK